MGGGNNAQQKAAARNVSATKRKAPGMANTANQNNRGAQGGWANGQLPVAMQQQMAA